MEGLIKQQEIYLDEVSSLNQFAREISKTHKKALDMLKAGNINKYNKEEAEYALDQLQTLAEHVPASEQFMKNVRKVFTDPQMNFTIQNFLTWHHIDSLLITYFRNPDRFEKFKSCAVTELDDIFVDSLERLIVNTDLSVDQLRYAYFVHTMPKLLKYMYFYNKTDDEIENDYNIIHSSRNGMEKLDIESLYALQLVTYNVNPMLHLVLQDRLMAKKSKFGASPTKMNKNLYGNIMYKGLTGQYKDLEKGEIIVKNIKSLDDEIDYFKKRKNCYELMSCIEDAKYKGAYINNVLIGVVGYTDGSVVNIHVDGDYRMKGVSRKLLESILNECSVLGVTPVGDSLDYIKRISKYDKSKNKGIVTLETLKGDFVKRDLPASFRIEDYNEGCESLVSSNFEKYFNDNYNKNEIETKVAIVEEKIVGYIAFDRKNHKIALIEVESAYSGMGIASKLLASVVDYNVWQADLGKTGVLFWFGRGINHNGKVYVCSSRKRLNKYAKENGIKNETVPRMYIL